MADSEGLAKAVLRAREVTRWPAPVTGPVARRAAAIPAEAGPHGHRHAVDAMLSAAALAAPGPVTVLTPDPEDIATLCGRNVTIIKVLRDDPAINSRRDHARPKGKCQ